MGRPDHATNPPPPMSHRIESFVASMNIQPDDEVLEIGCGHGVAATLVCSRLQTGHYLAVDRSRKMVDAASKRNAAFVAQGVAAFMQGSLETIDLGERRFDKVFALRVRLFHDQPDRARALAARWLKPGGQIHVQYDEPIPH